MTDTLRALARAKATFQARALEAVLSEQPKGKTMTDEAPERIWLQDDGEWCDESYRAGEITWCDHAVNEGDTEYVRADLTPQITDEMVERAALAIFKAWYGDEEGWASVWHLARPGHMEQARAALTAALATQEAP